MGSKKNWWARKIFRKRRILRIRRINKGYWTEERFKMAIENGNGNNPDWYKGISKATNEQDRIGIDFVVHTAQGDVLVQIKSSQTGADKFLKKKRKFRIIVLVIRSDQNEENIRDISFSAIQAEIDLYKKPSRS